MNQRTRIGNGNVVQITASFGITQLIYDVSTKTAIEYADRAMYESKRAGRNRVRIWEESQDKNTAKNKTAASS
jgi:PleD family two-component response regulator